ncbi:Crp/Fnr family transcriptional regulator [Salinisphaera aquimarina]|uniref:Crp/Fnr family transcriptional regulator n=1 Tax=Salinisphaera aquimarina TaxID=2094031 RepID=A0ABV7ET83_9GAMM
MVAKLKHYIDITDAEHKLLGALEKTERSTSAGEEIFAGGDVNKNLFVVKYGWLYTYTNLPDGGRLVVRVYHAGDIIGMPALAFDHHTVNLRAVTKGCLCPFPKSELDVIVKRAPRITALLFTIAAREEAILVDTLRAASRMRPESRVAHLLLGLHARLKITNSQMGNRFRLPLNQTDIGDAIGLTNVTVSRTFSIMEKKGLIERVDGEIILIDLCELERQCDFQDRHAAMDTSWFPSS